MFYFNKFRCSILYSALLVVSFYSGFSIMKFDNVLVSSRSKSTFSPKASKQAVEGRWRYFNQMLSDPVTGKIPADARVKELKAAAKIPAKTDGLNKTNAVAYSWKEAGPNDVGGRTRALAVDVANSNTIIAGGVSGGIWKSTDGGSTWNLKTASDQIKNVTCIAQDPRSGHTNTWYFGTGELRGNTAGASGAPFRGIGIFKSNDNGETWNLLSRTAARPYVFASIYNYTWNIKVSPTTGTVFLASSFFGIKRSTDGGITFVDGKGTLNAHQYCDVAVTSDGKVIAALTPTGSATPDYNPGIWKSTDDGATWTEMTPSTFPAKYIRVVLATAPSNNTIAYALVQEDNTSNSIRFYKLDINGNTGIDRTNNLPAFSGRGGLDSQSSYNMVLAVKPDDPNFVVLGLTNLFRSFDGFATKPTDETKTWIGGYGSSNFQHENHHPDQHAIAFDPNDPKKMWSGHDGGLSYADDISQTTYAGEFPWTDKNNGYNVTQFYTVAIKPYSKDGVFMGGAQDNGSPAFFANGSTTGPSSDVSSGDGAYSYMGSIYAFTSSQYGRTFRVTYNKTGIPRNPFQSGGNQTGTWSEITPDGVQGSDGQMFINPFVVDPNKNNRMFYLDGEFIWRNNLIDQIPNYNNSATSKNWEKLTNFEAPTGAIYTALAYSTQPANILYYASYDGSTAPKLWKLTGAHTATSGAVQIVIPGAPAGSYVKDIEINPADADEVIVVLSNYNIVGLYRTTNGGSAWQAIEGNLTGESETLGSNTYWTGPSLRNAEIVNTANGKIYFIGTSTGLYSTQSIAGSNTFWVHESPNDIGNTVVAYLESRTSDSRVVVGTHGRGIWYGDPTTTAVDDEDELNPAGYSLSQNYPNPFNPSTVIGFTIPVSANVNLTVYNSMGEKVTELVSDVRQAGKNRVVWNAADDSGRRVSSGVYFYTLTSGNFVRSKKMILLK